MRGPPVLFVSAVCLPSPSLRFPPSPLLSSPSRDSSPLSSRSRRFVRARCSFHRPRTERRGGVGVSAAGVVFVVSWWRFCLVRTVASLSGRPRIAPSTKPVHVSATFTHVTVKKFPAREKKFPGSPFRATWKLLVCSKPACL